MTREPDEPMMVKLIALGLSPPVWKNVFHHIRTQLPQAPFAASIFSTADDIAYLQQQYFPAQWRREEPDFLFSEAPAGREWRDPLRFLAGLQRDVATAAPILVLVLSTLDHSIRQLIQGPYPIRLVLDNGSRIRVSDPAMVVNTFPAGFPRLSVQGRLTRIRLRQRRGKVDEIDPLRLAQGVVLSLDELEAVELLGERMDPAEWMQRFAKAEKLKLPKGMPLGLLREAKGLYLFPGVPVGRVSGVCIGDVEYSHLLDMGQMTEQSPQFAALLTAVGQASLRHAQRLAEATRRLSDAAAKRDLPIVCGGSVRVLNEIFAERLAAEGFVRLATLEAFQDDLFREPTLIVRLSSFPTEGVGVQVEPPTLLPIEEDLAAPLAALDGLPPLDQVPYAAGEQAPDLSEAELAERKGQVLARGAQARAGRDLAQKRVLLIGQEHAVLETARQELAALLEAKDSLLIWNGSLPSQVKQVLVFSHDQEEAGAVLHALGGVSKKRWFDLSPFTTAESIHGLARAPVEEYRRDGVLIMTASSRERLNDLRAQIDRDYGRVSRELEEAQAALTFYQGELDKAAGAQHALIRRWLRGTCRFWLQRHRTRFAEQLDQVRLRHERQWLSRAMIHRVLIVGSSGENRPALQDACRQLYPGYNDEHSVIVPYDFEPLDYLPREQAEEATRMAREEGLDETQLRLRLAAALAEQNQALFNNYLEVLGKELEPVQADLVLIEQRASIAGPILEFLRGRIPELKDVPAVLIVPEYWTPPANQPLPWPNARVAVLRRMGGLNARECEQALLSIHPA
ncbi:MAG: hypothetical protein ACHQZQ_01395 [SAR324 cluster bacterium]